MQATLVGLPNLTARDTMADPAPPLLLGAQVVAATGTRWSQRVDSEGIEAVAASLSGRFGLGVEFPDGRCALASDRFASHGVCWRVIDGRVRYAERADQLGAVELDPQSLFDYLFFHNIPSPRTIFKGVFRLPAGHFAESRNGKLTVSPYWRPHFDPDPNPSFDRLKQAFRDLLRQSVADALVPGKQACFLSGGTDSSTVAGHIRQIAGEADTYSIGFDAEGYDEMAYARLASKHFGTRHHEYYVTPDDLVNGIADVAGSFDQPFGNSSVLPAYYCARRAREDGVSRLLAGDGGDELFGGNSRYALQSIYGLYRQVPAFARKGLLEPIFSNALAARTPLMRKGFNYIRDAKIPLPDRLQHYNLLRRLGAAEVLTPGFIAAIETDDPLRQQRHVWSLAEAESELNRMLAYDWRYTLAESDLPKVIGATRLAGIDTAFPFLDQRLVDFSLRLPDDYKLRRFKLRWFFKEALRDFLPEAIITKQKKGFGLPFGVWTQRHAGLHALASDSLRSIATRGVVRPEFVRDLLDTHLPAHPGYYGEMVWILMMLEQWLRQHSPDYRFS